MSILAKLLSNQYEVESRGIINFFQNSMDSRSIEYLEKQGIERFFHVPKCITRKDVKESSLILLMDFDVYDYFSKNYRNALDKTFLFNSINNQYDTSDPVRYDDKRYFDVMENIKCLCSEWANQLNSEVN